MSKNRYVFLGVAAFAALAITGINASIEGWGLGSKTVNEAAVGQIGLENAGRPPFPLVSLPRSTQGDEAIAALGDRLPEVAAWYGLSTDQLKAHLRNDNDLKVDPTGRLLYVDSTTISSSIGGSNLNSSGPLPLEQTFTLHSRPGVTKVIYLDFDGNITSGTSWNSAYAGGADIVSAPFDLDGDPSSFNSSERSLIQNVWLRVAEDYAPFNVDVTTQDPGIEALRKTTSNDSSYGIRVVLSPTNWYKTSAGGVAYIGSYTATTDTPCFGFTDQLANGEKYIAEAASHESGHTLGLYHDGYSGGAYYYGQGNWAPIMGVGYYSEIVQFSKGEYSTANNPQDDLQVIQTYGLSISADDYGNTISSAGNMTVSGNSISAGGLIEKAGDIDMLKFSSGAGDISINVGVAAAGANLDVKATLYNSNGNVITSQDPFGLPASISATVPSGTYYLAVTGVGAGDPVIDGYSNYGSLGQYYISGTIVGTNDNPPVVNISANPSSGTPPLTVQFSSTGSYDPENGALSYSWNFGDNTTSNEPNPSKTYQNGGNYTATLTATDVTNLSTSKSVPISVVNQAPVANFTIYYPSNNIPATVTLDASSSYDPDGVIASYSWDFGDGNTATGVNTSHTYSAAATFPITLTVTDANGMSGTKVISFSAVDVNIVAAPTNLTGSAGGKTKGQLTLKWVDNSNNETSFAIERAIKSTTPVYQVIAQTGANVNTYTHIITAGTYLYRVRAFNADTGKYSGYSNTITVRAK